MGSSDDMKEGSELGRVEDPAAGPLGEPAPGAPAPDEPVTDEPDPIDPLADAAPAGDQELATDVGMDAPDLLGDEDAAQNRTSDNG